MPKTDIMGRKKKQTHTQAAKTFFPLSWQQSLRVPHSMLSALLSSPQTRIMTITALSLVAVPGWTYSYYVILTLFQWVVLYSKRGVLFLCLQYNLSLCGNVLLRCLKPHITVMCSTKALPRVIRMVVLSRKLCVISPMFAPTGLVYCCVRFLNYSFKAGEIMLMLYC